MHPRKVKTINTLIYKVIFTFHNFKKIAYHHYGDHPASLIKFIYYTFLRINTFIIFECDLTALLPQAQLDVIFKVIQPTMEELDRLRSGKVLPREFYYDQLHKVSRCHIALYENEMAYIHWLYSEGDYSRFLKLRQGVAEINYVTTLPKFRGKKLSSQMLIYASRHLQKLGYKKAVIVIHHNTVAFIKNVKEAGFKEVGRLKAMGPFNRKVTV